MRVARFVAIIAWCAVAVLLGLAPAVAEKRVALVIGNGAYKNASKLPNPTNDAKDIAGMLQSAGFDAVELHENLGIRELRQAIADFAGTVRDADTAVVYYSGHGIEVNGINYLIPIDAVLNQDIDVSYETFSLENLVQVLEPARRLRLVMLDACRDNPFVRSMKRTVGTRAIGRGLAAVEPTSVNTVIGFAAKAGSYALDGDGANSPYATGVLNHLATPGLDLRIAFGRVRDEVLKSTKNKQEPFVYGSLGGGTVSIVDAPVTSDIGTAPPTQAPTYSLDRAAQAWAATKDTTSIAILEDFIKQFGSTTFGSMARARLAEIKKSQGVVAAPPQVSPPAPPTTNDAAERVWAATKDTTSVAILDDFIRQFGNTPYGSMARARRDELKKSQIAVAAPRSDIAATRSAGSVTGTWTGQWKCTSGPSGLFNFTVTQNSDGTFSGSFSQESAGGAVSGKVSGNRISFNRNVNAVIYNYIQVWNGTLAESAKTMQGSFTDAAQSGCTFQVSRR